MLKCKAQDIVLQIAKFINVQIVEILIHLKKVPDKGFLNPGQSANYEAEISLDKNKKRTCPSKQRMNLGGSVGTG